jgi:hypothetical protein
MDNVLFSYKVDALKPSALLSGKPELFSKLKDREISPFVTLNGEAAFNGKQVEVETLVSDDATRSFGRVSLESVGAIVNRLDRLVKLDEMPAEWQDAMPASINENELRSLVFRKHRVQEEVLGPLDLGMPTQLINSFLDIDAFIHNNPSDSYILKPTSGTFGKGIFKLRASEIADHVASNDGFGKLIIQPAYDFSLPLPSSVKPFDKRSSEEFDLFSASEDTKELRMYTFYSSQETAVFPVGRMMKDGVDNWFFMDPDSLPEKLTTDAKNVAERAARLTGSRAVFAALDMAYGKIGDEEPGYQIVELNGRMPYLIGYDKHPVVADILRDRFADQIQQTVQANSDKIQ